MCNLGIPAAMLSNPATPAMVAMAVLDNHGIRRTPRHRSLSKSEFELLLISVIHV